MIAIVKISYLWLFAEKNTHKSDCSENYKNKTKNGLQNKLENKVIVYKIKWTMLIWIII
jgi:hypothetical protein